MPQPPSLKELMKKNKNLKQTYSRESESDSEDSPRLSDTNQKRFTSKKANISDEKLETLLKEWAYTKKRLTELEETEKKYKDSITKLMNKEDTDSLFSDSYIVKRRIQKRKTISQKDLPQELWEKYAKQIEYPVITLKKL